MNILVHGSTGKMGQRVIACASGREDLSVVACVAPHEIYEPGHYRSLGEVVPDPATVLVDFSHHSQTKELLNYCLEYKLPLVLCTTGHDSSELECIKEASQKIPLMYSGNMSVGIASLTDLVRHAAQSFPDADVEIVETHHNQKLDVPSGTALMLAHAVQDGQQDAGAQSSLIQVGRVSAGKRAHEICIHSLRMGTVVGEHTVYINTGSECIELKHTASSRDVFAEGALRAALWIVDKKPSLYSLHNMLEG